VEHLQRFGLERDPFRSEPNLEFWFASTGHVGAGRRLRRCVEQAKELCVLVGPVGSGTTTVLRALFEQLDPERFEAGIVVSLRGVGPDELRAMIGRQLGIESAPAERAEALRALFARLVEIQGEGRHAVVGIDEAHALGGEALAELRALLQLEHDDRRLLSVVLAGTPLVCDAIAGDTGLPGRVDLEVHLAPLDAAEAHAYLAHRIEIAGGVASLFDAAVLDAITTRAGGLPRRLNALADATLFEAHLAERAQPTPEDVERAANDLPWARRNGTTRGASTNDDLLDASLGAVSPIESLRDADSASFADLDLPEETPEIDVAREVELALAPDDPTDASLAGRFALDRTVRDAAYDGDLLGPEETAPGAWQSPPPLATSDDDVTASRRKPFVERETPPIPSDAELDDLFVDLVDEVEPERT
jgi:type II secretory pathway predicted ATPase ExeA